MRRAFDKKIDLRSSYLMHNLDLDTVLIRVKSTKIPGYLRSRVYEYYHAGSWNSDLSPTLMNLLTEDHEYTHNTYSFNGLEQEDRKNLEVMEVYYSSDLRVSTLLHKGKSRYLEMKCETLDQTECGTVTGKELEFSGGITLYTDNSSSQEEAFEGPVITDLNRNAYLQDSQ